MSNNLPDGVSENTFGAPWNDQNYICDFYFQYITGISDVILISNTLTTTFVLSGPQKYNEEELVEAALETIKAEYSEFLSEYDSDIIIEEIDED